jgi:hypothetical protein
VISFLQVSRPKYCMHLLLSHYHHHPHWQNSHFLVIAFLRRFCKIASGFHFFGFRNDNFFYIAGSSALRPTPNMEDQVSVFTSPRDRPAQLYPQVPGSLFVALYDSQGYGGGILTRLHTGRYYPIRTWFHRRNKLTPG